MWAVEHRLRISVLRVKYHARYAFWQRIHYGVTAVLLSTNTFRKEQFMELIIFIRDEKSSGLRYFSRE